MELGIADLLVINEKHKISLPKIIFALKLIANACLYLHEECNIAHNDIKIENIIWFDNEQFKLADFGFAAKQHNITNKE